MSESEAEEPSDAPLVSSEGTQAEAPEGGEEQAGGRAKEACSEEKPPEAGCQQVVSNQSNSPSQHECAPKPAKRNQQRFKQQPAAPNQQQCQQEPCQQVPVSADYLAQLIKDKQQLSNFPLAFMHVQRLIDHEINKVRQSLFQLTDVVGAADEPLELPAAEGEVVQVQEKIYVPVGEHPEYNFVGRLLGPRGMTAKQLEQETGCKIMIRGRGSMRDKKKEEQNRGKANWEHLYDELHVLISVEDTQNRAHIKLKRALEEVKQLLIPIVDGEDELKKRQLMELAIINGTYRDCNYNEALTKILNDAVYRQQTAQIAVDQPSQPLTGIPSQPVPNQRPHYHYSQPVMNGSSGSQPDSAPAPVRQPAPTGEPQKQMNLALLQHQQTVAALAAAHRQANANTILLNQSAAAAAASHQLPATTVSHAVASPRGPPMPPPPSPPPPLTSHPTPNHLHHQQTSVAAASAVLMANHQAGDPSALMYAQQYHDFHHYAAMAAAAASQPLLTADFASHHHPQHYQQQVDHSEHHHQQQQQHHHHQQQQQQQHQAAAAAAAAALAFHHHQQHQAQLQQQQHHQQQQQQQLQGLQESSANKAEGDNGNESGGPVEQLELHNPRYQVQPTTSDLCG